MLSRLISRTSQLRFLTQISSNLNTSCSSNPLLPTRQILESSRFFSSNRRSNGDGFGKDPSTTSSGSWRITPEINDGDSIFGDHDDGNLAGIVDGNGDFDVKGGSSSVGSKNGGGGGGGDDDWVTAEGYKDWSFDDDEKEVFDIGEISTSAPIVDDKVSEFEKSQADKLLEQEKEGLSVQLKGPNRAFGDLIAASGITNEMIDSLILLKDFRGVEGLPPLRELEDLRLEKNERKSTNAEIERKKQEEVAKSRVRQVDEKGRAYGTGKRKCSIARVWIQPGDGKFIINDKQFDVYFPILDHRADLLRPFSETKTLGLWDVKCTVKGGGTSGQVGAIRLGISRALQNWEPGLRPYLRSEGFLTRDSRVVERKKPGKAKARKSFQWVKR